MGCHIEGGSPGNSKTSKFLSFGQFRTIYGDVENFGIFAFFENMQFHSITLSPYMGYDSVTQFLNYENKYAIL